ncbi:MAG: hypothetical protein HRU50_15515 [Winogradskyella sp.]|uniref:hypothetical protein n=1 Tax=Winogradskyella sp. TaxID=1883156 RepID=UPI0025F33088|nr:hypothetical protein [Winogradskyella sp.]NRB61330.1 hypothetical protein [Winogradskyella sp.]
MKNAVKILSLALLFNFFTSCTVEDISDDNTLENTTQTGTSDSETGEEDENGSDGGKG